MDDYYASFARKRSLDLRIDRDHIPKVALPWDGLHLQKEEMSVAKNSLL